MSVRAPLGATSQSGGYELRSPRLSGRAWASGSGAGALGLAGLLVTGVLLSLSAAGTDPLLPESARPMPSWLAGPFGATGLGIGHGGAIVVLILMMASYVLAVRSARAMSARVVLATIAALHALVVLAPPLLSTDVFSYVAYGRMGASYGANPYLAGPHTIALDAIFPFIGAKWAYTPTTYGPLFTALSYPLAPLGIAATVAAYKAIAAVASLALVGIVWNAARLRGIDPIRAAALVGLNPLIVVYGVGGGHNDLLMLTVMMAGVYALLQRRERIGGAMLVSAVGLKLTAGLLLPFAYAASAGARRRRDLLVGAGVAMAAIAGLAVAMFGPGPLHLFGTLSQTQSEGDWKSIPGVISTRLGMPAVGHIMGLVLFAAFACAFAWLVRRVWRGEIDWIAGAGWATAALLIASSSFLPWYVAWLIPLAALGADRRLWNTAMVMTCVVQGIQLLGYIPHVPGL